MSRGRRPSLPQKLRLPEFLEPTPPVESVRLELSINDKGCARMKLILVCHNGYVFEDETELDSFIVEWRFEEGVLA